MPFSISRTEPMLTMAGTAIKMDMLWKLTPCGSTTDTGIRLMIQQILNRDDMVFLVSLVSISG